MAFVAVLGFVAWGMAASPPMQPALDALQSDAHVLVMADNWIVFRPTAQQPSTGFIIYPGGRVDARAYAPTARAIAAQGHLAVITPMPLNLAVLAPERAADVIAAFPNVTRWAVGGHSLGGVMAAHFAHEHPRAVQGLFLWAAYPADFDDLSAASVKVVSLFGTRDGLATPNKIAAARRLLSATTRYVAIEGGNHGQFGWYGMQDGDHAATISREEQQAQVVAETIALFK